MKKDKVSIIIAAYNEEKYIDTCLSSLKKQTYNPIEIILADDGSTDSTRKIAEKHDVVVIQLNHAGTAIARNTAAEKAKGEILVFLDADMEFKNDFIEKLTAPIREGQTKGTFSKLEYVKNWDNPYARCWNRTTPGLPDKLRVPQNKEEGDDFRALLKEEFMRVKGFDNTGYTDTWTLAKKLGYKPQNAPNAIYYHYNPETLEEIFKSAQWIGKRNYKLGAIGTLITVIKTLFPFSLVRAYWRAFKYKEIAFVSFQITYDYGIFTGALNSLLTGEVKK